MHSALHPEDAASDQEQPSYKYRDTLLSRNPDAKILYTVEDLMVIFGLGRATIYKMMATENWPHSRYGGQKRFEEADLEAINAMHRRPSEVGPPSSRRPRIGTRARHSKP